MHTQTGDGVGTIVPLRNTHPLIGLVWVCLVGRLYGEYVHKWVYVFVFRWRIDIQSKQGKANGGTQGRQAISKKAVEMPWVGFKPAISSLHDRCSNPLSHQGSSVYVYM